MESQFQPESEALEKKIYLLFMVRKLRKQIFLSQAQEVHMMEKIIISANLMLRKQILESQWEKTGRNLLVFRLQ